jgi:hypothetical protein
VYNRQCQSSVMKVLRLITLGIVVRIADTIDNETLDLVREHGCECKT